MMSLLDLFSGIGGFSLGLERTGGFRTVAFCEVAAYPRAVLKKHWPEVPCYDDIRTLTAGRLATDGISVDAICGGFPCQDISVAGKGAGLAGERSGLWREYARLIGQLKPRWVIAENVSALRTRGLDQVLRDLDALGYDAEWHCIPASAAGAPHRRDRIWIVAHPAGLLGHGGEHHAGRHSQGPCATAEPGNRFGSVLAAHGHGARVERSGIGRDACSSEPWGWRGEADLRIIADRPFESGDRWPQPLLRGMAHGVPARVDRLKCVGNAVVPAIPEAIGRAILAVERQLAETAKKLLTG